MSGSRKKKRTGPGRPPKLNDAAVKKILAALRTGAFRKNAARWSGIGERTFREWMARGKLEPTSAHGEFRRNVIEAESAAEIFAVRRIYAEGSPEVMLKFLAIRHRKRWNPKQQVELTGKDGGAVKVQVEDARAKLAARIADLAAASAAGSGDPKPE